MGVGATVWAVVGEMVSNYGEKTGRYRWWTGKNRGTLIDGNRR